MDGRRLASIFFMIGFPWLTHAASIPTFGQSKDFNMKNCVQESTHDCIKASCIEGTPTNCNAQCRDNSVNKCKALAGQQWIQPGKY